MGEQQAAGETALVAVVDEMACIGCTLCRRVCPTDAFVGAAKMIHTVLEEDCTGCGTCLPVCPVGCITFTAPQQAQRQAGRAIRQAAVVPPVPMEPLTDELQALIAAAREKARTRHGHLAGQTLGPKVSGA